jgi:hypothetical protein
MTQHLASRTLVKSHPELWAECSDASSLARHLGYFGEIRITRVEPETAVAWEGEVASGTVRLEPSGWGTRVILTAHPAAGTPPAVEVRVPAETDSEGPEAEPVPAAPLPPAAEAQPAAEAPPVRVGFFARLRSRLTGRPMPALEPAPALVAPEPEPVAPEPEPAMSAPEPAPEPAMAQPEPPAPATSGAGPAAALDTNTALAAALDSLGQAHHRPFSRG